MRSQFPRHPFVRSLFSPILLVSISDKNPFPSPLIHAHIAPASVLCYLSVCPYQCYKSFWFVLSREHRTDKPPPDQPRPAPRGPSLRQIRHCHHVRRDSHGRLPPLSAHQTDQPSPLPQSRL